MVVEDLNCDDVARILTMACPEDYGCVWIVKRTEDGILAKYKDAACTLIYVEFSNVWYGKASELIVCSHGPNNDWFMEIEHRIHKAF